MKDIPVFCTTRPFLFRTLIFLCIRGSFLQWDKLEYLDRIRRRKRFLRL